MRRPRVSRSNSTRSSTGRDQSTSAFSITVDIASSYVLWLATAAPPCPIPCSFPVSSGVNLPQRADRQQTGYGQPEPDGEVTEDKAEPKGLHNPSSMRSAF